MVAYDKFLPEVTPLHAPFWSALKQHRVDLQRCDRCGEYRFIPTEVCSCGSAASSWTPVAGTGAIYSYAVVHRAPTAAYQADAPYVIAHVTMDEGPRMISTLVDLDPASSSGWTARAPSDIHIGMPVEIVFDDVTPEFTLYRFRPRPAART